MIQPTGQYPKFLKCSPIVEKWDWNKFLPFPWKSGELVKVAEEKEQTSSPYVGTADGEFRKKYVVIYRKSDNGKFLSRYVAPWEQFELLNKTS